jgi:hypothetical protein
VADDKEKDSKASSGQEEQSADVEIETVPLLEEGVGKPKKN